MQIVQGTRRGERQSLGSFGAMVGVLSAGQLRNRTAWHYHQWRRNMLHLPGRFRKGFGFGIPFDKWMCLVHHHSSSRLTTMVHFLWHQTTPITVVQNTSIYDIISFVLMLKAVSSKSSTHQVSPTLPISSPNRLDASNFKNTLHD